MRILFIKATSEQEQNGKLMQSLRLFTIDLPPTNSKEVLLAINVQQNRKVRNQ